VACDDSGLACFDRIRHRRYDETVFMYAFDLIELNGDDLRRDPLEVRKATLVSALARPDPASASTSILTMTMARPSSAMSARWA
jgi:ATP-dependent DNA ligase